MLKEGHSPPRFEKKRGIRRKAKEKRENKLELLLLQQQQQQEVVLTSISMMGRRLS
jgi:hypothetical protein